MTPDPEIHIHRIGRTGRGDQDGWALSLYSASDKSRIATIARMMDCQFEMHDLASLHNEDDSPLVPPMATLQMLGGRKDKIRPGDVLGALTGEAGFTREQVGKITVTDQTTYVAVVRDIAREAVRKLSAGKVKGRTVKVHALAG
jgi:ATP-independent RNA helicase DbpA